MHHNTFCKVAGHQGKQEIASFYGTPKTITLVKQHADGLYLDKRKLIHTPNYLKATVTVSSHLPTSPKKTLPSSLPTEIL
jgi:hypothetical protein